MEKLNYKSKNLLKLKNGYILEFNIKKELPFSGDSKIIFASFFNEFDNHYILQTARQYIYIRKDKERDSVVPYVKNILPKEISREELFSRCFENLEHIVQEDTITEKQFDKHEKSVRSLVQDYSFKELHTFIANPIFNEYINLRTKK